MKRVIAAVCAAVVLAPTVALAQRGYPRFVERDGETCVVMLNSMKQEVEHCRSEGMPELELQEVKLGASSSYGRPWSYNARRTAEHHAGIDEGGGGAFGGGVAAGFFLGPLGWIVSALAASNSRVVTPTPPPAYEGDDRADYRQIYMNEVQAKRTRMAIAGGVLGTALAAATILLVVELSED